MGVAFCDSGLGDVERLQRRSPGIRVVSEPRDGDIAEMKRDNVKVIFVEPYFDLKTPNSVAAQTGAKVVVLLPSVGGEKEVTDYFKLFDYDVNLMVQAFQATR